MGIIEKRLQDPESNPPLRIAVFGGSVTLGRGCDKTNLRKMQNKECAWPKRFERLINQFFGREIIQVFNLAIGGTSTISATSRVKYWMYGDPELDKLGPDVIINSYSTNDSIVPWGTPPEADLVKIVGDNVRDRLEPFIRETLQSKGCDLPPLIVHVDDSLGPHQPTVLGEMSYVSEMTRLAKVGENVSLFRWKCHHEIDFPGGLNCFACFSLFFSGMIQLQSATRKLFGILYTRTDLQTFLPTQRMPTFTMKRIRPLLGRLGLQPCN